MRWLSTEGRAYLLALIPTLPSAGPTAYLMTMALSGETPMVAEVTMGVMMDRKEYNRTRIEYKDQLKLIRNLEILIGIIESRMKAGDAYPEDEAELADYNKGLRYRKRLASWLESRLARMESRLTRK